MHELCVGDAETLFNLYKKKKKYIAFFCGVTQRDIFSSVLRDSQGLFLALLSFPFTCVFTSGYAVWPNVQFSVCVLFQDILCQYASIQPGIIGTNSLGSNRFVVLFVFVILFHSFICPVTFSKILWRFTHSDVTRGYYLTLTNI